MSLFTVILIGVLGGISSGVFGIGGGTVIVPALVYYCSLTQHQAQGTVLAVLMVPVSALAVWRYYQNGNVNVQAAVYVAVGFIFGALLGAHLVQSLPEAMLKRLFGVSLILIGIKMAFLK